ncbi:MAG: AAA family ATPase, partial [Patescibacteria group bacterium]
RTYYLRQYGEELSGGVSPVDAGVAREVEELEAALTSSRGANALVVADAGSGEDDIIYGLVGMIERGTALPELEGKRVFQIDTVSLVNNNQGKLGFENTFIRMMNEAVRAGNVIVVVPDLPGFLENAASIGSDAVQLLEPYLRSSRAQIVATADRDRFHEVIERRAALVNAFELIRVGEKGTSATMAILENMVPSAESRTGTFYTYQAVKAVADSATRFFSETTPLGKARDLLFEAPAITRKAGRSMVTKDDVMTLVEMKTGVPQEGKIKEGEEDKLLNLEKLLHERVIGQDEAVSAVANAMRRARAGLRNTERPIGSFLFLGPTGVGKTETAKALGEVFFGETTPFLRLDMSEYSGGDSLARLIGFAGGRPGILASMLRDQKYGVLLLDEFEKTTSEVMNLFLQILDEGFFSDAQGKKTNARNLILIATSNAGSDEIFRLTESGTDLAAEKDAFTRLLIGRGSFTAELLNRFDGVILFHPLSRESLKQIAFLVARKFAKTLKAQGIILEPTADLVNFLAEKGYDPKFGARPMNRVLQEKAEKLVAEALIGRTISRGATISLVRSSSDPNELEIRVVPRA